MAGEDSKPEKSVQNWREPILQSEKLNFWCKFRSSNRVRNWINCRIPCYSKWISQPRWQWQGQWWQRLPPTATETVTVEVTTMANNQLKAKCCSKRSGKDSGSRGSERKWRQMRVWHVRCWTWWMDGDSTLQRPSTKTSCDRHPLGKNEF